MHKPSRNISILVQLHAIPDEIDVPRNCFGYLADISSNAVPDSSSHSQLMQCRRTINKLINKANSAKSYGHFYCSRVTLCSNSECDEPHAILQCFAGHAPPFTVLFLNELFLRRCGFCDGDQVILTAAEDVRQCDSAELIPETYEDWNIIQNSTDVIEEIFLHQIRILHAGMPFVLFLGSGIAAKFRTGKTVPDHRNSPFLVTTETQILVKPIENTSDSTSSQISERLSSLERPVQECGQQLDSFIFDYSHYTSHETCSDIFRILPNSAFPICDMLGVLSEIVNIVLTFDDADGPLFVKSLIVHVENLETGLIKCAMLINIAVLRQHCFPEDKFFGHSAYKILESYHNIGHYKHCWISSALRKQGFDDCTHMKMNFHIEANQFEQFSSFVLCTSRRQDENIITDMLRRSFAESSRSLYFPLIFPTDGSQILLKCKQDEYEFLLVPRIANPSAKYAYFWPDSNVSIVKAPNHEDFKGQFEVAQQATSPTPNFTSFTENLLELRFQTDLVHQIVPVIMAKLQSNPSTSSHLLVTGGDSTSKSCILQLLEKELFKIQYNYVISHMIPCRKNWKGKSLDAIMKQLQSTLSAIRHRRPAVLFLDDFDFFDWNLEDENLVIYVKKIYSKIINEIQRSKILCICSTNSSKQLPTWLAYLNGHRLFSDQFEIPRLNQDQQLNILASCLDADLSTVRIERDLSYAVGELITIAQGIRINCAARGNDTVTKEDIEFCLINVPTAGRAKNICMNEKPVNFGDIGGMNEIKQRLVEIFIWPTKYPQVYNRCGIRVGTGVILHGPSGCGKSLLIKAIANEAKFNVISVKGPELLSKYIGQSEENVRNIFDRARSCRPCILVFDEFDALVPMRGHDNTGVTDRVVNQFLTELDGVASSMEGVYVLGATNRINLIDQALLRPGRFDHKIYVGPPKEKDRLEILNIHSRSLVNSPLDLGLCELAKATEGWAGSELRGLIVSAQFEMLAERKERTEFGLDLVNSLDSGLKLKHIAKVFDSCRPKRREISSEINQPNFIQAQPKRVTSA
ncbi:ATPase family associated with various cellular activities (AAA) domain-containing protein [Ditylenchus destructor]|uniref:Peroxisomal ATPase PEX1 n=1 Tax=Ditylenchus destructor TaxID=166010 RepID=A0AAD4QZU1_9BILA|nr:ATPase family associated with various cellular activities (AAA) domain-containing protein [Ditylenchus destructor]